MNQTHEGYSVAEKLNYIEKSYCMYKLGHPPPPKCVLRHMEISLSSQSFRLPSIEKERSSLAQTQAHTVTAPAICSR